MIGNHGVGIKAIPVAVVTDDPALRPSEFQPVRPIVATVLPGELDGILKIVGDDDILHLNSAGFDPDQAVACVGAAGFHAVRRRVLVVERLKPDTTRIDRIPAVDPNTSGNV